MHDTEQTQVTLRDQFESSVRQAWCAPNECWLAPMYMVLRSKTVRKDRTELLVGVIATGATSFKTVDANLRQQLRLILSPRSLACRGTTVKSQVSFIGVVANVGTGCASTDPTPTYPTHFPMPQCTHTHIHPPTPTADCYMSGPHAWQTCLLFLAKATAQAPHSLKPLQRPRISLNCRL